MREISVAVAQFRIRYCDIHGNMTYVRRLVEQASSLGSTIIVLPELWATGYCSELFRSISIEDTTRLIDELRGLSKDYNIYIVGSVPEKTEDGLYNTGHIIGPENSWFYRKAHLIRLLGEHEYFKPGSEGVLVANTRIGRLGIAICYDIRFPEYIRLYALRNAEILLVPAEWPLERIEHWRLLLRARAIENQFYVLASNTIGDHKGVVYGGHSAIVDPWGEVVLEAGSRNEALLVSILDLDRVSSIRDKLPLLSDRRRDLYRILDIRDGKNY